MRNPTEKIMDLSQACRWRENIRLDQEQLVVTNGCFDLIHRGHVEYLQAARAEGDVLLVGLNSDASIRNIKGNNRPVISENDRAFHLASLEAVDCIVIFSEPKATNLLEKLMPDIYVKGGDYNKDTLDQEERQVLDTGGARLKFIDFVQGCSTTALIEKIRMIR